MLSILINLISNNRGCVKKNRLWDSNELKLYCIITTNQYYKSHDNSITYLQCDIRTSDTGAIFSSAGRKHCMASRKPNRNHIRLT